MYLRSRKKDLHVIFHSRRTGKRNSSELRALLADLVRRELKTLLPNARSSDLPRNAVIYFVVGAVMSVIIWWLEERSKLSPVEVDAIFRRLTLPAILVERKPE